MTDKRIYCPFCRVDITGDARDVDDDRDLLGDWDCDNCKTSFSIRKLAGIKE